MESVIYPIDTNEDNIIPFRIGSKVLTPDRRFFFALEGKSALEVILHPTKRTIQVGFFHEGDNEHTYIAGIIDEVATHHISYSDGNPTPRVPNMILWDFRKRLQSLAQEMANTARNRIPIAGIDEWITDTLSNNAEHILDKIDTHNEPFYRFRQRIQKYRNARDVFSHSLSIFPEYMPLAMLFADVDNRFVVYRNLYLALSKHGYPYFLSEEKTTPEPLETVKLEVPSAYHLLSILAPIREHASVPKSKPITALVHPTIINPKLLLDVKPSPSANATMYFVKTDELNPAILIYETDKPKPSVWFVDDIKVHWRTLPMYNYYLYRQGMPPETFFPRQDISKLIW